MKELREAFEEFNLHEETDVEVMKRLVSVLRNNTASVNQKLIALQDLEYYVHQVSESFCAICLLVNFKAVCSNVYSKKQLTRCVYIFLINLWLHSSGCAISEIIFISERQNS